LLLALFAALVGPPGPLNAASGRAELSQGSRDLALEPVFSIGRKDADRGDPATGDGPSGPAILPGADARPLLLDPRGAHGLPASPAVPATSAGYAFRARAPPLS
jgi:hypothetical protein